MILHLFGWILILFSPLCMGLPWVRTGGAKGLAARICFAYVTGYFLRLTLFQAIALPMTLLGTHFSTMSNVFTVVLVVACGLSAWLGRDVLRVRWKRLNLTVFEKIYGVVCVGLILFQLYMCIVMDPTSMTYDDAVYTVYSSDALATDYMFITSPLTGNYSQFDFRVLQTSLLFPAYIVRMTGMSVTVVERTFSYALNLLTAYACYAFMSEDLYKKKENRLIFLILISVIYIFGYHSHYSMTFRLLGPNSQGKAILAVVLVPMLLILFRKWTCKSYNWKFGLLLFFLSVSASCLSLMGAGYMIAIVVIATILSFLYRKEWRRLRYIFWACAMPGIYAGAYILLKYSI